jgi:hypothetical protein
VASAGIGWASDLDDGISVDDNISSYDTMGKTDQNIKFIKMNAKSQAKRRQQSVEKGIVSGESGTGKGGGAMNSVVMGAGSNVRGDIIIIDESKGDKTQVVE